MRILKLFFLSLFLLTTGCSAPHQFAGKEETRPLLLVSIAPYKEILEKIVGDSCQIIAVVPPGADPHTYEPTSRQTGQMSKAVLWLQIGESFEPKLFAALKRTNPKLSSHDLLEDVPLLRGECHHGSCEEKEHLDRHIWLSPKRVKDQALLIAAKLQQLFPEKEALFSENLAALLNELDALDDEIQKALDRAKSRTFLVSHPAFAYFCEDYGFQQLSIEHEGQEPRPKHLETILAQAEEAAVKVALTLPEHNNRGTLLISEKLAIPTESIDPYSPAYFSMMRSLTHVLEAHD